jgi:hypothetical protein
METPESQDFVVVGDEDLDEYDAGILPQSLHVIADIKKWLQPTDYLADSSEYNKHLHNHVKGTGLWIQETEAYRKWHESSHQGSLWVKAIAGAGKSVFAAMIARSCPGQSKFQCYHSSLGRLLQRIMIRNPWLETGFR